MLGHKVVVFIGKWASDTASAKVQRIPFEFINRQRSLSRKDRESNRAAVVDLIRKHATSL
jgi:hypothetical protein